MKKLLTWKTGIVVLVCTVLVACMLCVNSSLAWYTLVPGAEHAIIVEADGTLYIQVPPSADEYTGEGSRTMKPAVALPFAVANGAPINVLQTYEETKDTDHPSYVQTKATYATYSGEFEQALDPGTGAYLDFHLSVFLTAFTEEELENGELTNLQLGKEEFVFDDISFKYYYKRVRQVVDDQNEQVHEEEELVEVNALTCGPNCWLSEDNSSGRIFVRGDVKLIVQFSITMHIANVDELMDSRIAQQDRVYCCLGLHANTPIEWQEPEDTLN